MYYRGKQIEDRLTVKAVVNEKVLRSVVNDDGEAVVSFSPKELNELAKDIDGATETYRSKYASACNFRYEMRVVSSGKDCACFGGVAFERLETDEEADERIADEKSVIDIMNARERMTDIVNAKALLEKAGYKIVKDE